MTTPLEALEALEAVEAVEKPGKEPWQIFDEATIKKVWFPYDAGYIAVGILREPLDHRSPCVNTVWVLVDDFFAENYEGGVHEPAYSTIMTEREAKSMFKGLSEILEVHKEYYEPLSEEDEHQHDSAPRKRIWRDLDEMLKEATEKGVARQS